MFFDHFFDWDLHLTMLIAFSVGILPGIFGGFIAFIPLSFLFGKALSKNLASKNIDKEHNKKEKTSDFDKEKSNKQ